MDWLNIILVSISMSVDCMTIGATDGIQEPNMKKRKIFFIAFIFGLFQGLMPTIGYFVGYYFREKLEAYIPWIAFTLLCLLGIKNIFEWVKDRIKEKKEKENPSEEKEAEEKRNLRYLEFLFKVLPLASTLFPSDLSISTTASLMR